MLKMKYILPNFILYIFIQDFDFVFVGDDLNKACFEIWLILILYEYYMILLYKNIRIEDDL